MKIGYMKCKRRLIDSRVCDSILKTDWLAKKRSDTTAVFKLKEPNRRKLKFKLILFNLLQLLIKDLEVEDTRVRQVTNKLKCQLITTQPFHLLKDRHVLWVPIKVMVLVCILAHMALFQELWAIKDHHNQSWIQLKVHKYFKGQLKVR